MANQSYTSFPTNRWADSDPGSILDTAFASIDGAIRHLFGLSTNVLTPAFSISNPGVITVLHSIGIGTSNKMIGILNEIPDMVGPSEDQQLATVQAIRRWVNGGELLAEFILVDTSNFDGILSAADDTVQKALDTIDDHNHDGRYALIVHNHDSRYYTETEVNNLLLSYLPLTAGPTKKLIGNLHIGGFSDPGIFIGPESLASFYTHIYDIGAYSYYDQFSGNTARLLINPHPNGSAPSTPAGYMPGWGPNTSIFRAWIDLFAETNTSNEVKLRLHPGVGLRDGSPSIVFDAKGGYADIAKSGGRVTIDNTPGVLYEIDKIILDQTGITKQEQAGSTAIRPGAVGIDFTNVLNGLTMSLNLTFPGLLQFSTTAVNGYRFDKGILSLGTITAQDTGTFRLSTPYGYLNVAKYNSGPSRLSIGEIGIPLSLQGSSLRPKYTFTGHEGVDLALYSDIAAAAPGIHTHPYDDYVLEPVTNGNPVTPEILFDLDGDVVTIEVVTPRVTGTN